jgi:hypothetical protein
VVHYIAFIKGYSEIKRLLDSSCTYCSRYNYAYLGMFNVVFGLFRGKVFFHNGSEAVLCTW